MQKTHSKSALCLERPNIVGTFYFNKEEKPQEETYPLEGVDAIETRLDLLERLPTSHEINQFQRPLIATARHSAEGGNPHLEDTKRIRLLQEAIPLAAFIDIELRFWEEYPPSLLQFARESGVGIIASFHDFVATPPSSELLEKVHLAHQWDADIFKVATYLKGPADLACLLQLLTVKLPLPVAVMGMGPLGMASRLALARCGSVLNYGSLGSNPLITGQLPAGKFAEILKMLNV